MTECHDHSAMVSLKEWIHEYHTFELRKYELDGKKIIAVIDTIFAVVKRKPEKNQACRDSNSMTSAIPVQRSNQLS